MAEKELRRLKRKDLLQMLLVQCEETERLQKESEEMKAKMESVLESYERLKKKLDVKDERLNQKDAKIAELKAAKESGEEKFCAVEEAFYQFRDMFEEIQKTVERCLLNDETRTTEKKPYETGRIVSIHKKQLKNKQLDGIVEKNITAEKLSEKKYGIASSGDIYG